MLAPGVGEEARALNEAFDAAQVRFNDRSAALAAFRENHEITWEDGKPFTRFDGEVQLLSSALLKFGFDRRDLIDGRSLPRSGAGASRPGVDCKTNYKTVQDKVAYVNAHGTDAWERLPISGPVSNEIVTQADWYRLPRSERVRLTALDPDHFAKLAPAPKPRPTGAFINHEAIEQQKSIRPASRKR
jgi:hypothetical protein